MIYHGSYDSLFNKKKQYLDIENRRDTQGARGGG
jgi:hypothetical protein